MISLKLGHCLDHMADMPGESVGHIVTDPPYGQTNEAYDRGVDPRIWRACYRVSRPGAALIAFAGSPTYHRIASDIESAGWKVRQMWGWVYRDGLIVSSYPKEGFDRLAPAMDPICFASKGKLILDLDREGEYGWDAIERDCKLSSRCKISSRSVRQGRKQPATSGFGHWPRTIVASEGIEGFQYFIWSRAGGGHAHSGSGHPSEKPLWLMEWIVSELPKSGPIYDPFAGSATTLIAAMRLGFDATGSELDPAYHAIGESRIEDAVYRLDRPHGPGIREERPGEAYPLFGE